MKKIRILAALVIVAAMIAQMIPAARAIDDPAGYTVRDVHIYRDSLDEDETVECRFYDELPGVPYIDYALFVSTFCGDTITVVPYPAQQGDFQKGLYVVVTEKYGAAAVVDTVNDLMAFYTDIATFLYAPSTDVEGASEFYYLGMKLHSYEVAEEGAFAVIPFAPYGIDIIEDDGALYFPVPTLSDLYSAVNQMVVYYNGEVFYYNSVIMEGGARDKDRGSVSILVKNLERSPSLINYTYREICFNIDNFYGFPCTQSPFMDFVKAEGLDAALDEYDPRTKELLMSPRSELHIAGLYRLFNFWLCDGGHTGLHMKDLLKTMLLDNEDYKRISAAIRQYGTVETDYVNVYYEYDESYWDWYDQIRETRSALIGDSGYVEYSDTALISLDGFDIDFAGWKAFLEEGGPIPTSSADTFGFVWSCLERAKENPKIRNVIFDLTANSGGYVAAYIAIMSLINGTADYNLLNVYTGERVLMQYLADRNLDGTVDDADLEVDYSCFNFGVLTSSCSFSCGNLFPAAAKDAKMLVFGERSGGGSCSVAYSSTAEGVEYNTSAGADVVTNRRGLSIDDGVPVNPDLTKYDDEGNKDYSDFFDLALLSTTMNKFYKTPILLGDANGDKDVNMKDVLLLRRQIAGLETIGNKLYVNADYDGDGELTMKDVLAMRRFIAGI